MITMSFMLLFSISLLIACLVFKTIGKYFALDHPDDRKKHSVPIPQIGGIIFGFILLLLCLWYNLVPNWYLIGGIILILLGTFDDLFHISWYIKLIVQIILAVYISVHYLNQYQILTIYLFSFQLSNFLFLSLFILWFIFISNSINLLDGVDGLAGGFMAILCICAAIIGTGSFKTVNMILFTLLIVFLIFNQRDAKYFMGDAGSLFLGFHCAVLPLLYYDNIKDTHIDLTFFIIMLSFPIADTIRVFITRILQKKNPMKADSIHLHHVIIQESGSYLGTISMIYMITVLSAILGIYSVSFSLSINLVLIHISVVMFFILMPPVLTYVPIFTRLIQPFHDWQLTNINDRRSVRDLSKPHRTTFILLLVLGLLSSIYLYATKDSVINWEVGISFILILLSIYFTRKDRIINYIIQVGIVLLVFQTNWGFQVHIITKLCIVLLIISYIVFTIQKESGSIITSDFSALDLLMIYITIGGIVLYFMKCEIYPWVLLEICALWFGISFVLRRTRIMQY